MTRDRPQYREGREALLEAATRVIARDGFRGLTYRSVATEAGVTHGLVTYHFGTREALIHEALLRAAQDAIEQSSIAPQSDRIEDFARGLPSLAQDAPDAQAVQFELALEARRRPALRPEIEGLYERYVKIVGATLEGYGIPADAPTARLVFAALDGLTLQQLIFDRPQETEEALAVLHRVIAMLANAGPASS
ncbi:MAG: transcriptional regulator, TetR family [Solirubrobacterales bacterium]|nr:transcriptional regulator, TetR family [Solirubrobacterales bacterium]